MITQGIEVVNEAIKIWVPRKACHECMMTPERVLTQEAVDRFVHWTLYEDDIHHVPECHCVTIRRMRHWGIDVPGGPTCCFGYFYRYAYENVWLRDAIEHRAIEYFDIDGWEGLRESGLKICEPVFEPFHLSGMPLDIVTRVDQKLAKQRLGH